MVYDDNVFPSRRFMHLILVAERLGASSRRPRHPFSALMAGVNPGPAACAQGPYKHIRRHSSRLCMITGTSKTIDERRHVIDHTAPVVAQRRACATPVSMQNGATVGDRLSSPRLHSKTAGPARPTTTTLSMYSNWRISVGDPRESAFAPRQGCRRTPRRCMITGTSTASMNCTKKSSTT